jgi:hypothetical protein
MLTIMSDLIRTDRRLLIVRFACMRARSSNTEAEDCVRTGLATANGFVVRGTPLLLPVAPLAPFRIAFVSIAILLFRFCLLLLLLKYYRTECARVVLGLLGQRLGAIVAWCDCLVHILGAIRHLGSSSGGRRGS